MKQPSFWRKTWDGDVNKTSFTISLDTLEKEKAYAVKFTRVKIYMQKL